jgi:hypothetical protein
MSEQVDEPELNSGSRWRRWEPHIHAPGTAMNDQFGADSWSNYLRNLETATPKIEALAVTDYYITDTYQQVVRATRDGRLTSCKLIFPNVELRLGLRTIKGRFINLHLLVSPDDPNHVEELERFLSRLSFSALGDRFACTRAELIRLGRTSDPSKASDKAALEHGANQFKVEFQQLQAAYRESDWARENILIAISGTETDGTSGMRDAAEQTLREEMEKFAHIIFASSPAQRDFWLGLKSASPGELRERYDGLKPCLHGCDAHDQERVGKPDGNRYSWVKGSLSFDSLKQACIDPAGRAYVGVEPPGSAISSQIITQVEVTGAPWAKSPKLALNSGLVAIIGARGSGKTALADIIAQGCDSFFQDPRGKSFLTRAQPLLAGAGVKLLWKGGAEQQRRIDGSQPDDHSRFPRVRYLSQQFVENLCSAEGMTDELLKEVERVVFEAHPLVDREGAVDFAELREMKTARFRRAREREEDNLADLSDRIGSELEKEKQVPHLRSQVQQKQDLIKSYEADRKKLVTSGGEARVARLTALNDAAEKVRGYLRWFSSQEQSVQALKDEVDSFRATKAPEALRRVKEQYQRSGITDADWAAFLLKYSGDVDAKISEGLSSARRSVASWKGTTPPPQADAKKPLIPEETALDKQPLALLEAEIRRLEALVNVDRVTTEQYRTISSRISAETQQLQTLADRLKDAEGAAARAATLVAERQEAYVRVFDAIISEADVLSQLYAPLLKRLAGSEGSLSKLSFTVTRTADVARWADEGELLLDLRKTGPKGRGTLQQCAQQILKTAWEEGDSATVSQAMAAFRESNQKGLLEHAPVPKSDQADYRAWTKKFAKWLYGTSHINIHYGINYDGIDITKLSPGTRGIVLLLLYLALDNSDDRPLVIDQPEENLDPKSIHEELVGLFITAKEKRQVIIVTHNANLVVNTDADQIIIASSAPMPATSSLTSRTFLAAWKTR